MPLSELVYCVAIAFKMTQKVEQRICIKLCIKLEHFCTETIQMIQKAFKDNAMSAAPKKSVAQTLQKRLRIVESDPCLGRPATSRTSKNVKCEQAAINKCQKTVGDPKVPTLKKTEVSLSYVQCFLHLVSSSVNEFLYSS